MVYIINYFIFVTKFTKMQKLFIFLFTFHKLLWNSTGKNTRKNNRNPNKPLPGISISIQDSYDGATSDSSGNFSFTTTEKGAHVLPGTSSGYKII